MNLLGSRPPRILIVDSVVRGHHSAYIRWIADGAMARGYDSLIVTPPGLNETAHFSDSPAFIRIVLPAPKPVDPLNVFELVSAQIKVWSSFKQTCTPHLDPRRDLVIVPYFDSISYAVSFLGSPFGRSPWIAIAMRAPTGALAQSPMGRMKKRAFRFACSRRDGPAVTFLIDRESHTELSRDTARSERLVYLPDPVEPRPIIPKAVSRERLNLPSRPLILLVYGAITHRKGVRLLLELIKYDRLPSNVHVVIAGEQDAAVNTTLKRFFATNPQHRARVSEINRYLSKDEEGLVFSASDLVWLVYEDHFGMSGVLVQAAFYGLPTLVSDQGLLGWYAAQRRVAAAISMDNPLESGSQVISALAGDEFLRTGLANRARNEFSQHTIENFQQTIFEQARRIAGDRE